MNSLHASSRQLFEVGDFVARELTAADLAALQAFFVANPEYFLWVNGIPPRPNEAKQEFEDRPPAEMPFTRVYVIGFADTSGQLVAMASVLSDLLAKHVWHIGLFIVGTALHGTGAGTSIYAGLEQWMKEEGAAWLRLGVVAGNVKAERFWEKLGYLEINRRVGMQFGNLTHTVRVLVKPLSAMGVEEYLRLVSHDRYVGRIRECAVKNKTI